MHRTPTEAQKTERADVAKDLADAFAEQFAKMIGDAGQVLEVITHEEAKGGGWTAILDTEYAALKLHYAYRIKHNHKGVRMYAHQGRWNVSNQPDTAWMVE